MSGLLAPQFQNDEAARAHLERTLWPDGPVCPHCGIIGEAFRLKGETNRDGLWKCSACREPFTVTIGTIFEDSHIPLHKWLLAIHLMCSSKKGISAHQLWRNLWGVNPETGKPYGSYRSAWFMAHRIRWALGQEPVASKLSGIVEIDEAYIGGKFRHAGSYTPKRGERPVDRPSPTANRAPVLSILQRDGDAFTTRLEFMRASRVPHSSNRVTNFQFARRISSGPTRTGNSSRTNFQKTSLGCHALRSPLR
jgi:hypothetical protein